MAELVDAPDLGSGVCDVQVRVLSGAHSEAFGVIPNVSVFWSNRHMTEQVRLGFSEKALGRFQMAHRIDKNSFETSRKRVKRPLASYERQKKSGKE